MTTFTDTRVTRIDDRDYLPLVLANAEIAKSRIWVCLFLLDIRPTADIRGQVMDLAMTLIERAQAGVDVRVLLTGQVRTPALGVANVASGIFLKSNGVPHRRVFDVDGQRIGTHAKFVICDNFAFVGSQNWTDDGFNENTEDGVIMSGSSVELLCSQFARLWTKGRGLPKNETN